MKINYNMQLKKLLFDLCQLFEMYAHFFISAYVFYYLFTYGFTSRLGNMIIVITIFAYIIYVFNKATSIEQNNNVVGTLEEIKVQFKDKIKMTPVKCDQQVGMGPETTKKFYYDYYKVKYERPISMNKSKSIEEKRIELLRYRKAKEKTN